MFVLLPMWHKIAYMAVMEKCYADPSLHLSKGEFEKPKDFAIKVDCYSAPVRHRERDSIQSDSTAVKPEEQQNTDEFGL